MSGDRRETQIEQTDRDGLGKAFWLSAVIALVVLIGLVAVLVIPGGRKGASSGSGSSESGSGGGAASRASGWDDHGCNGSSGDSKVPTAPPSGVTWQPQGSMSVPTSSELGPKRTEGVVRTCFQHSPSGALLAASNILIGASSGPQTSAQVMSRQITEGAGKNDMIAGLNDPNNKAGTASPSGFQVGACTPSRCIVSLLASGGEGAVTVTMPMVWSEGDWKLDGTQKLNPALAQGLPGGWVQWPVS